MTAWAATGRRRLVAGAQAAVQPAAPSQVRILVQLALFVTSGHQSAPISTPTLFSILITKNVSHGEGVFLSAKDQPFHGRYIEIAV